MRLVNRVITRDASKMAIGQVFYTPWCDEDGKVIDDGTVTRAGGAGVPLDGGRSEPAMVHRERVRPRRPHRGHLRDASPRWRCRARRRRRLLQADLRRRSRHAEILPRRRAAASPACRSTSRAPATPATSATRSGCRGTPALQVWDAIAGAGAAFDLHPAGMLALDVARIEAGLLLIDVDFHSSRKALIESQKYSPFEMGLGRLVDLKKARSSAAPRCATKRSAASRGRSSGSRWTGPRSSGSTKRWACRRPRRPARRAWRCRSTRAAAGRPRDVDDVVDDAEEVDRAGDGRRAALRDWHAARDGDHRRSRPPPRRATVVETPFFNPPRKTSP